MRWTVKTPADVLASLVMTSSYLRSSPASVVFFPLKPPPPPPLAGPSWGKPAMGTRRQREVASKKAKRRMGHLRKNDSGKKSGIRACCCSEPAAQAKGEPWGRVLHRDRSLSPGLLAQHSGAGGHRQEVAANPLGRQVCATTHYRTVVCMI